jgi:uncharacterized protein (DUF58 family)
MSSEALVGIGITLAWLGLMCLLLGWAEYMRSVPKIGLIWLVLGVALVIVGGFIAALPRTRDRSRIRAERSPRPAASEDEAETVSEPEEQRF